MLTHTGFLLFFVLFCREISGSDSTKDNDDATTVGELKALLRMQSEELADLKRKFELLNNECVKKSDSEQTFSPAEVEDGAGGKDKSEYVNVYH